MQHAAIWSGETNIGLLTQTVVLSRGLRQLTDRKPDIFKRERIFLNRSISFVETAFVHIDPRSGCLAVYHELNGTEEKARAQTFGRS